MAEKIGFIGLGNMGTAIWKAIRKRYECIAFDPDQKQKGIEYYPNLLELSRDSDILILAVKPAVVYSVLRQLPKAVSLISIAAGVPIDKMRSVLPPGCQIVRTMPNLPLLVGKGAVAYYGDSALYPYVESIFSRLGLVIELPREDLLDAVTGLSGSGPAFVFSFIQALAEGGVKSGLSYKESLDLSLQTVLGSVEYVIQERRKNPNLNPIELRNRVTSPGGTTIFGLSTWEKNSTYYGIMESVYHATLRAKELGKENPPI